MIKDFIDKYLIWFKLAAIAILIAAVTYGIHLYNESLREEGRQEVRAEVAKQDAITAKALTDAIIMARLEERADAEKGRKIAKEQLGEIQNEKSALQVSLDDTKHKLSRLRSCSGTAATAEGMPSSSISGSQSVATGTTNIPADIVEGFRRLREIALRTGSACNETAITLNKAQEERASLVK